MKKKKIFLLIFLATCMVSCKEVYTFTKTVEPSRQIGNEFDVAIGMTENDILRSMSAPTRTTSDGKDGKILIYEDIKTYISTTGGSSSSTRSSAEAGYTWSGNPAVAGNSTTTTGISSTTVSGTSKKYVNFFINSEGVCYDVNANYGDIYSKPVKEDVCYKILSKKNYLFLIPPLTIYGLWVAIPTMIQHMNPPEKNRVECQ